MGKLWPLPYLIRSLMVRSHGIPEVGKKGAIQIQIQIQIHITDTDTDTGAGTDTDTGTDTGTDTHTDTHTGTTILLLGCFAGII